MSKRIISNIRYFTNRNSQIKLKTNSHDCHNKVLSYKKNFQHSNNVRIFFVHIFAIHFKFHLQLLGLIPFDIELNINNLKINQSKWNFFSFCTKLEKTRNSGSCPLCIQKYITVDIVSTFGQVKVFFLITQTKISLFFF